jgi:FAD/FMN-containing dehydrogenase
MDDPLCPPMANIIALKREFKGDIVTPLDSDYSQAIARWALNAKREAKIVAFVKDPADVALAIKYAKANSLPIAICGGGHSPYGASSSDGGLVIDLSRHINGAVVDPEKKVVRVGGGAVWRTVDKAAIEHGLATVAGTVNHVCFLTRLSVCETS